MYARERLVGTTMALVLGLAMITGLITATPSKAAEPPVDAWITGIVDDGSEPLEGIYVKVLLFTVGGIEFGYDVTDSEGVYDIGVPGGFDYMVLAANGSYYMSYTSAKVSSGETAWANLTLDSILPLTESVTIKGYVKEADGTPSYAGHVLGLSNEPGGEDMPYYANVTRPELDGYFETKVIEGPRGGGVIALDFPGYAMVQNMTDGPFVAGNTYWVNITLVGNSALDDAMMQGHVTDRDTGMPIAGALVSVGVSNEWVGESYSNATFTDSSGYYEMYVTNGSARLMVMKEGYSIEMYEDVTIVPHDTIQLDAELVPLDCVVRGLVSDLKSGEPLPMARILLFDSEFNIAMTTTDSSGEYELDAFSGDGLTMIAERDGYSRGYASIDLSPGEEALQDFGLWPTSSVLEGTVRDAISGAAIDGVEVWASSDVYDTGDRTDSAGHYMLELVPGTYRVEFRASGYLQYQATGVELVDEQTTVFDVLLLLEDPPLDTRVYGWVNDSGTTNGIESAEVRIGLPEMWIHWSAKTDSTGYYELQIPSVEQLTCVVAANQYSVYFDVIDVLWSVDYRMDVVLDPDSVAPAVIHSQSPLENVSWTNPCAVDVWVTEENLRQMVLFQSMMWYSDDDYDHYYLVDGKSRSFDPFEPSDSLQYTRPDVDYLVEEVFDGSVTGGWLGDGTNSAYLPAYEQHWGPTYSYYAMRGFYSNDTLEYLRGNALFDIDTGEFEMFYFDDSRPPADSTDMSGLFCPEVNHIYVERDPPDQWYFAGSTGLVNMSVASLSLEVDPLLPSVRCMTLFMASDFGNNWNWTVRWFTVDNVVPVADAGPDKSVKVGTETTVDGSGSTDNVGIAGHLWEFEDGGVPVTRDVAVFDYTFATPGTYVLTLTVVDGAGHEDHDTTTITVSEDMPPVADAGEDQEVPEGTVVEFDGTGSSDDVPPLQNWTWTIVELSEEMYGPTPSYTFSEPGVYGVELVVTDSIGQTSEPDTMTVTVLDVTPPVADAGPDPVGVLVGDTVVLNGSNSSDNHLIESYTWNFTDEIDVVLSGAVVEYVFDTEGDYVVTLTVTDTAGNSDTDTVVVRVASTNSPPVARAGLDQTVKQGETVTLDGSESSDDVGIETYTWTFEYDGEVRTLSGEVVEFVFDIPGTYIITLNVTDAEGEWNTDTMFVIVEEKILSEYWWLIAALAAVAVIGVLVVLMRRGKGGPAAPKEPEDEDEFEEDLPPPDDEDA